MTTPGGTINWMANLEKQAPELFKQARGLQENVLTDGALSAKTKNLMMMLGDALLGHAGGVASIAQRARSLGANDSEIAETLAVAFLMGGMPALITGANAFRD